MKRVLMALAGLAWFALVFLASFRYTFPSDAVAERVRFEVQERSGGAWALDVRDVVPWWVGASGEGLILYKRDLASGGQMVPAFAAESARVRVGLASLLRNAPRASGALQMGSSEVSFVVGARMNQKGTSYTVGELQLAAPGMPLADLAALGGLSMEASGALDVAVDFDAADNMRNATGQASVHGADLVISKLDLSSLGVPDLGLEIPIEEIDVRLDVAEGKATVSQGVVRSSLATVEISGDITLRDDLERSSVNIALLVGDLGPQLTPFKGFLGEEWPDGKLHFRCSGTLSRNSCRPERERAASSASTNRYNGSGSSARGTSIPSTSSEPTTGSSGSARSAPMDEEERQRRRDELRERLRQRREERASGTTTDRAERPVPGEEEYVEEPPLDEELPPEEEFEGEEPAEEEEFVEGDY